MIPKISIIIPVYHVEEYITMCLQSVANQTMTEGVECILVDDCGGDRSIDIANSFVDNYSGNINFKIVYRDKNGGLSAARNSGIRIATGEYLYFLDSDDEITPDCIWQMWQMIEKYGKVDLVQGTFIQKYELPSNEKMENIFPEYSNDKKVIKKLYLKFNGDIIPAQTKLISRDFLLKNKLFFKEGIIHEDNYWSFFLAKHVSTLTYCKNQNYFHRDNPTSITHNINVGKENFAYKTIINDFCNNIDPFLKGKQKALILNTMICAFRNNYFVNGEKQELYKTFLEKNSVIEKLILNFAYFQKNPFLKTKLYNLIFRIYNL